MNESEKERDIWLLTFQRVLQIKNGTKVAPKNESIVAYQTNKKMV